MNKKIIVMITLVLSFVLFVGKVEAGIQELTCIYDKTNSQPGVKFVQTDENSTLYLAPINATEISISETNWVWFNKALTYNSNIFTGKKKNDRVTFNSCPKCINYSNASGTISDSTSESYDANEDSCGNDGKLLFESKSINTSYAYRIVNSSSDNIFSLEEREIKEDNYFNGNWIGKCTYASAEDTNTSEIMYVFSENDFVLYDNNINVTGKLSKSYAGKRDGYNEIIIGDLHIINHIKLTSILDEYEKNYGEEKCENFIYKRDLRPDKNDLEIEYDVQKPSGVNSYKKFYLTNAEFNKEEENISIDMSTCNALLGEETVTFVNEIMKWIRIIVPILLIIFGVIDFTSAVFSSKDDDVVKIRKRFIMRILAAILVFLSPILINLLLSIANEVWYWINPDTCLK